MIPRLASVSFLNSTPLVEWFRTCGSGKVNLELALPSELAAYLAAGRADVGLLPTAELLTGKAAGIVPDACIASSGPVDSVKVFVRGDLATVTRVSADRGSRSSVALLRVILAEIYGLRPTISETKPRVGSIPEPNEAVLVIGDRCFAYEKALSKSGDVRAMDLASLWRDMTGLPFVFAVWAAAPGFPERVGARAVAQLGEHLRQARDYGLAHATELAVRAAADGCLGPGGEATAAAIDYYFRRSLQYTLGPSELAGIRRFQELSITHGVLPAGDPPIIL